MKEAYLSFIDQRCTADKKTCAPHRHSEVEWESVEHFSRRGWQMIRLPSLCAASQSVLSLWDGNWKKTSQFCSEWLSMPNSCTQSAKHQACEFCLWIVCLPIPVFVASLPRLSALGMMGWTDKTVGVNDTHAMPQAVLPLWHYNSSCVTGIL